MKRFIYKAKNKEGKTVKGEVEASNANYAAKLVRKRGLLVLNIRPARQGIFSLIKKMRSRITTSEIAAFTRQLSTMINAGLPITESLSILRMQSKTSLQPVVTQILADVEGGESLSKTLTKHPKIFSPTYVALIKAGETGGVLDKVLLRLADNLEKQQEFRGKVKGALIYPLIVIVGMVVVSLIMIIFVIPKLMSLYSDLNAELPLPTKILMAISSMLLRFWPLIVLLLGLAFLGFREYRKTSRGRRETDKLAYKVPIIGKLQHQVVLAELTRTLGLMVGSGVAILEGLNVTAGVVANTLISDALRDAAKQVEKGFPIAYSFAKHPQAFPYILSQMVAVGEETGKMEEVLFKVSRIFEMESEQKVKGLTAAIEPLVMIILGLGVGFLVISVILPIYNLTSQF